MNSVILIGRLTKDPELKYTASQTAVTTFTIAAKRPFSKDDETDFLRVVTFGKTAENCNKYLSKGNQAGVQGRIQTGSYETDNGEKRYTTDIIADRVEFLQSKSTPNNQNQNANNEIPDGFQAYEDDFENIPF